MLKNKRIRINCLVNGYILIRMYHLSITFPTDSDESNVCHENEYDCDDATCIDASLECNGIKNCRHEYDEEGCTVSLARDQ